MISCVLECNDPVATWPNAEFVMIAIIFPLLAICCCSSSGHRPGDIVDVAKCLNLKARL